LPFDQFVGVSPGLDKVLKILVSYQKKRPRRYVLPLPGLQFLAAWAASRAINGNLLAALLATFNTNPITTPFFAVLAMTLGHWMLGIEKPLSWEYISGATEQAAVDLWFNFTAIFTADVTRWDGLYQFWHEIYWPYFIGALGPGIILSLIGYYITIPLVEAYQKARAAKADDRKEKRSRLKATIAEAAARLRPHRDGDKLDTRGDRKDSGDPKI
jgi:uncharacterized protein (DUF2062 family)